MAADDIVDDEYDDIDDDDKSDDVPNDDIPYRSPDDVNELFPWKFGAVDIETDDVDNDDDVSDSVDTGDDVDDDDVADDDDVSDVTAPSLERCTSLSPDCLEYEVGDDVIDDVDDNDIEFPIDTDGDGSPVGVNDDDDDAPDDVTFCLDPMTSFFTTRILSVLLLPRSLWGAAAAAWLLW